jgi:hypothetical protein
LVIGEETLSSTSVFSFSQPAILRTAIKSVIFRLMGNIGSYVMWTLPRCGGNIKRESGEVCVGK